MRYRQLGLGGDYTVDTPFLINSPACVAQAILTRLKLFLGEWFVDTTDGTPWFQSILGKNYNNPDALIKQRIIGTQGVTSIATYSSSFNGPTRALTVNTTANTLYGITAPVIVSQILPTV
jgi:hypothetical protein